MATPTRRSFVVFAPPPCHRLPCRTRTLPRFMVAGMVSISGTFSGDRIGIASKAD
jgi:hypothetical protein